MQRVRQQSNSNWPGSGSAKFHGNRSHRCHPANQLNHLLTGPDDGRTLKGCRHFPQAMTMWNDKAYKQGIRTFAEKYAKSSMFKQQNITKLINIDQKMLKAPRMPSSDDLFTRQYRNPSVGVSKMKDMLSWTKKTGIYRNFYKSQLKRQTGSVA